MTRFENLLQMLNMTKAQLAKEIKIQPGTIYRWKTDEEVPAIVFQYLQQKIELGKKNGKR